MDRFEDEVVKVSNAVREVDPTRPTMTDGGGATKSNRMPVHGDHYTAGPFSEYPTLAYEPNAKGGGRGRWEWDLKRPRFIGEELFAVGHNPAYAYFGGEEVFVGQQSARRAVGIAVRMMTEGARWNGYGAIHFWQTQEAATGQYLANAPRAVFCRQWNWTFGADQTVDRTYGVFNDTHEDFPITFVRSLKFGDHEVRRRRTQHNVPPGGSLVLHDPLTLTLPERPQELTSGRGRAGPVAAHPERASLSRHQGRLGIEPWGQAARALPSSPPVDWPFTTRPATSGGCSRRKRSNTRRSTI